MPHTPGHVAPTPPSGYQQVFEDGRYKQVLPGNKPDPANPADRHWMSGAGRAMVDSSFMDQLTNMFRGALDETMQANKDLFTQTQAVTQAAGKQLGEARKEYLASGKERIKASPGGQATSSLSGPMANMLPATFLTNLLTKLMERIQTEGIGQKAMEGLQTLGAAPMLPYSSPLNRPSYPSQQPQTPYDFPQPVNQQPWSLPPLPINQPQPTDMGHVDRVPYSPSGPRIAPQRGNMPVKQPQLYNPQAQQAQPQQLPPGY